MMKINFIKFIYFFLLIPLSMQVCKENYNNCLYCDPLTNLCEECEKNIYKPDLNGGCEPSKQCIHGENFCNLCDQSNNLCSSCESGFFPDQNGGCSSTDNCIISYKGDCLQCDENHYLVGLYKYKYCKYKYTEDLQNCETLNYETGLCEKCMDGYFLNSKDLKCIKTENCAESLFGTCSECNFLFYLDKRDDSCKSSLIKLYNCKVSLDGETCDECIKKYYFSKNGKCVYTNYCLEADKNSICQKCEDNYYLTEYGNVCTNEKNCYIGDRRLGTCDSCKNLTFYYDADSKKCFSNQENNDFKFCEIMKSNKCIKCIPGYELGTDAKCSESKNCSESENGICIKCEENYHLGLDNKCTNIEKCIRTSNWNTCSECENNYYYDIKQNKCFLETGQFKGCLTSDYKGEYCGYCKNGYYLYYPNHLCYHNSDEGPLYKCALSNIDGTLCDVCQDDYYLGSKDLKCNKIDGCIASENEEKCIECGEDYCLDIKKGICIDNFYEPESEDKKIYYACNKTNEEGTGCALCVDEYFEVENGICVNKVECAEEKNGECIKCNEKSHDGFKMCLNKFYGCLETYAYNCLRCDNILNFDECTECAEGYEFNDNGECVQI